MITQRDYNDTSNSWPCNPKRKNFSLGLSKVKISFRTLGSCSTTATEGGRSSHLRSRCSPVICVCPCGLKELATGLRVGRGPWVGTATLTLILSSSLRRSEKRPVLGGSSSFWRCPAVTESKTAFLLVWTCTRHWWVSAIKQILFDNSFN